MRRRLATLAGLVVAFTAVLAVTVGDGTAHACSCASFTLLDQLDRSGVIVGGEPIERFDDTNERGDPVLVWRFRVDERFRGDTPGVIELQAEASESSCGPPPDIRASILALSFQRENGRFDVSAGCGSPAIDDAFIDRLYAPPPLDGTGPPAALVAADARDHRLAVVDEAGGVLAYLPSVDPTYGLAVCPGDEVFVQLRATSKDQWGESVDELELVRWSLATWSEIDAIPIVPVDVVELPPPIECRRPDGGDVAYVTYGGITTITDGAVSTAEPSTMVVPGPDDAQLIVSIDDGAARVSSGAAETDVTQFFDGGSTRLLRPEPLWSVQPSEEGWVVDFHDYVQVDDDTGRNGLRRGRVTPDGVLTPLSALIEIPTLGNPVGMLLPEGLSAPSPVGEPQALLERTGSEMSMTDVAPSTPTTLARATTPATASSGAMESVPESTPPDGDPDRGMTVSVEQRGVSAGRSVGLGAIVVLALAGAFGLRQLLRARRSG